MGNPVKLGRKAAHRKDMLRTMVTQLLQHERIHTTLSKAKALRSLADRMITCAKEGTAGARSRAKSVVRTDREMHKLFTVMAERYQKRPGGYTRVMRTGLRRHDTAPMAYIEFVDRQGELRPARDPPQAREAPPPPAAPSYSHLPAAAQILLRQEAAERPGQQP